MKKKIFSYMMFSFFAFLIFVSGVNAAITIDYANNEDNRHRIEGSNYGFDNLHTYYRVSTDGKIVFCDDIDRGSPPTDRSTITWANCSQFSTSKKALSYIMYHGYNSPGNTTLGTDKYENYFVTQAAIWYNINNKSKFVEDFDDPKVNRKVANLIKNAEAASKDSAEVKGTVDGNKIMNSNGRYYVSNKITLSGKHLATKITVKADSDAIVVKDINATTGETTFNEGDVVYVKVPVSNVVDSLTVKVSISAKTYLNAGTFIKCESETESLQYQGLLQYEPGTLDVSASIEFTATNTPVTVSKTAITGSKEIPGAKLEVKDTNGTVVQSWTSLSTAYNFYLPIGKYTLTETLAPKGYIKSSTTIAFEVKADGVYVNGKKVDKVVMKNEPILVTISKKSITGKLELAGAKLKITDENGNIAKDIEGKELEWVSDTKEKTFHLAAGTYILSETIAPEGYELSETTLKFTVTTAGKVLIDKKEQKNNLIVFTNTPEPQQVPTGSNFLYVLFIGLLSISGLTYFLYKKNII